MEALILAGGFGTRLQRVIRDVPKPMAPINGRPFLEIQLKALSDKGFKRVILSLGHLSDKIVRHFGSNFEGLDIVYEIEHKPLGTGGAVRAGIRHCNSDHVYVFNGDTYLDLEVGEVEKFWSEHCEPIIVAREVPDTTRYGRLLVENGRVSGFTEKGVVGPGLINAGCYVFPVNLLDDQEVGKAFSLEADYLAPHVCKKTFRVYATKGGFIDIGVPEDYERAQHELAYLAQ